MPVIIRDVGRTILKIPSMDIVDKSIAVVIKAIHSLANSIFIKPGFSGVSPYILFERRMVNVGTGVDLSIRALAELVGSIVHPGASLVFDTTVSPKRLAAAMFMMNPGDSLADVPDVGGALTQWHIHDNLCFAGSRVAGLTDDSGNCRDGLTKGVETPMMHVWIQKHPCGPFAALEGIGAGTIAEGETRACDAAHGGH